MAYHIRRRNAMIADRDAIRRVEQMEARRAWEEQERQAAAAAAAAREARRAAREAGALARQNGKDVLSDASSGSEDKHIGEDQEDNAKAVLRDQGQAAVCSHRQFGIMLVVCPSWS